MATRAYICYQNPDDGKFYGIYCHNDGYLSHTGRILHDFYNTDATIKPLIALGDLPYLGANRQHGENHYCGALSATFTSAYNRDWGRTDEDNQPAVWNSQKEMLKDFENGIIDYVYVYRKSRSQRKWMVYVGNGNFRSLDKMLEKSKD